MRLAQLSVRPHALLGAAHPRGAALLTLTYCGVLAANDVRDPQLPHARHHVFRHIGASIPIAQILEKNFILSVGKDHTSRNSYISHNKVLLL